MRNICQHPDDGAYFAITISTRESPTGYQLYGFKADEKTVRLIIITARAFLATSCFMQAAEFVTSAKAVVSFVQQKISEKRKSWKVLAFHLDYT